MIEIPKLNFIEKKDSEKQPHFHKTQSETMHDENPNPFQYSQEIKEEHVLPPKHGLKPITVPTPKAS